MGYPRKVGYLPLYELCSFESLAFTHPVRFQILKILSERPHAQEEICNKVPLERSTVSHHIQILLERDLIEYKERHPWIYYRLKESALRLVMGRLGQAVKGILHCEDEEKWEIE